MEPLSLEFQISFCWRDHFESLMTPEKNSLNLIDGNELRSLTKTTSTGWIQKMGTTLGKVNEQKIENGQFEKDGHGLKIKLFLFYFFDCLVLFTWYTVVQFLVLILRFHRRKENIV